MPQADVPDPEELLASITLDADRRVRADATACRLAAVGALRALGFQVTSEMATVVEAQRGSAVRSAMLMPDQVPLAARIQFAATPVDPRDTAITQGALVTQDTLVTVHLTDRSVSVVALGVQAPYVSAFQSALSALDQALAGLDPAAAAAGFPEPRWWAGRPQADQLSRHHEAGQRLVGTAAALITERLSGGRGPTGPSQWTGFDQVTFRSSLGVVSMDMATVRAVLAIPVMIGTRPAEIPDQLAAGIARLAATVEGQLNSGGLGAVEVSVPDELREAFEFLQRQFAIRSRLPVRTLCTCRDCRTTKVVNLDLKRLREKNRRVKLVSSVLQVSRGHDGPSPFKLFGAVFGQAKLDPDFVCARCESTEADEQAVTLCPGCGDLREESVLTTCSACAYDFGQLAPDDSIWNTAPPPAPALPPMPTAPPAPIAAAPTAPGFGPPHAAYGAPRPTCAVCGGSYPVLWSIRIPDGLTTRPLIVCATTPRCSPTSLVPPVRVPG